MTLEEIKQFLENHIRDFSDQRDRARARGDLETYQILNKGIVDSQISLDDISALIVVRNNQPVGDSPNG